MKDLRNKFTAVAVTGILLAVASTLTMHHATAQSGQQSPPSAVHHVNHNPGLPGWCETPVSERKGEIGCYTTATLDVGILPQTALYWHLDTFPTHAAAEAIKAPRSIAVESLKKHWLFTIAEENWQPAGGEHIATIGPLVVDHGSPYTARFMETVIPPGMQQPGGPSHRHPGPEAWYVVEGGQCLETPNGVMVASAGQTMLAPEGWPMAISGLGTETRRAVVLILHRSNEPNVLPVASSPDAPHAHWKPKGFCPK
jgi:quercetin dioxygenase-like cupin family protein